MGTFARLRAAYERVAPQAMQQERLSPRWVRRLLLALVVIQGVILAPFAWRNTPSLNDDVLHIATTRAAAFALSQKGFAAWLDPLEPNIVTGYPFFHAYPPLGHLTVAAVSTFTGAGLEDTHRFFKWLLLLALPIAVYAGLRRLGLRARPALFGAFFSHLLSTNGSHGWDLGSYTWRGFSLYAQLWAAPFFALAVGMLRLAILRGRSLVLTGIVVGFTALAHVVYGYMLALTAVALIAYSMLAPWRRFRAPLRAAVLGSVSLALSAFFVIPAYVDRLLTNPSVWMPREKVDSVGHVKVLTDLFTGAMFDSGRPATLSVLLAIGVVVCVAKIAHRKVYFLWWFFVTWLVLYFGRPTFGVWVDRLLPLSNDVHIHRFVGAVQFAGLGLMGLAADAALRVARTRWSTMAQNVVYVLLAVVAGVAVGERVDYFRWEYKWQVEVDEAIEKDRENVEKMWAFFASNVTNGERIYAGLPSNWGKQFGFGYVPIYAEVVNRGLPSLGYLYHVMALSSDVMALFDENKAEDYDYFAVGWVIAPADRKMPEFLTEQKTFGRFKVYRAPATGLVGAGREGRALVGLQKDFYSVGSKHFRSAERAMQLFPTLTLEKRLDDDSNNTMASYAPAPPALTPPIPTLSKVVRSDFGEKFSLHSEASRNGLAFVRTSYHPNWHVFVDGKEAKQLMVMPSFAGVEVPPGEHDVVFEYRADPRKPWLLVGGWSLVLLALAAAYQPWRRMTL